MQTIWSADFEKGFTVFDMLFSREDHLVCRLLQDSVKMLMVVFSCLYFGEQELLLTVWLIIEAWPLIV